MGQEPMSFMRVTGVSDCGRRTSDRHSDTPGNRVVVTKVLPNTNVTN